MRRFLTWRSVRAVKAGLCCAAILAFAPAASAETTLLYNGIIHTAAGQTFASGSLLIDGDRIARIQEGRDGMPAADRVIDLQGRRVYPGLIAVSTVIGLTEINAVRATQDATEVGDYTPDVESWIAVNPDSELLPVARANGIAAFEPVPKGGIVAGQSALMSMDGWTFEQMILKKPAALHVFWPSMDLNTTPRSRAANPARWKSLEDQAKERQTKLRDVAEFFEEARAYFKARSAAEDSVPPRPFPLVPAWEGMRPYVLGERPLIIHANESRQIRSAVNWAVTNGYRIAIAGGRDAWTMPEFLAGHRVPIIYEHTFSQPVRDTDPYDVHFAAPDVLRRAGVKVIFSVGPESFAAAMSRNLPYGAAQAIAFGLPPDEALRGLTLYPAELMGVSDRMGSLEPGKLATLFICDGDIFDVRSNVQRMWIAGREVDLSSRHTRLFERYRARPRF